MKLLSKTIVVLLLITSCGKQQDEKGVSKFNEDLADELHKMAVIDQVAAYIPQGIYKEWPTEKWEKFKDSVFKAHEKRVVEIFDKYGFVGIDVAGEEGSQNFWLLVQHSDQNPLFQQKVLEKMEIEVKKNNANSYNYALLVDRVNINTGKKQIYGTQVSYNLENGQAIVKNLEDSLNVNKRRKAIGLEPIEKYLNQMTIMHYDMNKEVYLKKGIREPKLYKHNENFN